MLFLKAVNTAFFQFLFSLAERPEKSRTGENRTQKGKSTMQIRQLTDDTEKQRETGRDTVELYVMGVLPQLHRRGVGRELLNRAREAAREMGYAFMQVKTVQMGKYPQYDRTNRFYRALGFKEFEVFPTLWDPGNPCQIYVLYLQ